MYKNISTSLSFWTKFLDFIIRIDGRVKIAKDINQKYETAPAKHQLAWIVTSHFLCSFHWNRTTSNCSFTKRRLTLNLVPREFYTSLNHVSYIIAPIPPEFAISGRPNLNVKKKRWALTKTLLSFQMPWFITDLRPKTWFVFLKGCPQTSTAFRWILVWLRDDLTAKTFIDKYLWRWSRRLDSFHSEYNTLQLSNAAPEFRKRMKTEHLRNF